ncbi:MAG: GNAT family protein [Anaerolineaceae bacterium]
MILRPMRAEDLERYAEFKNDVEVELLGRSGAPAPMELARLQSRYEEHLKLDPYAFTWFAIEAQGGKFIGQCLLRKFDEAARTCELGITIGDRDFWGRGYGRDAVGLLLKYAFRLRNMEKVWLTTSGGNVRAQRSYAACGFTEEGRQRRQVWLDGAYDDVVFMGILREDWQRSKNGEAGAASP